MDHRTHNMTETWIQVIAIIGSNLVIMLTFFGVSISLHNGMREEIRGIREDLAAFQTAMARETKEFHGRLCSIEEKNRGK